MDNQYHGNDSAWRQAGSDDAAPSAWNYACVAGGDYVNFAVALLLLAIWLAVALAMPENGLLTSLLVALVLLLVGTFVLLLAPVILLLATAMAWIVGRAMTSDERRQCIAIHRAADAAEVRALLASQTSGNPPRRSGWLSVFIAGALFGTFWGDDD